LSRAARNGMRYADMSSEDNALLLKIFLRDKTQIRVGYIAKIGRQVFEFIKYEDIQCIFV